MAILDVLCFPDERLRTIAKPVDVVDDEIREFIDNMFETMYQQEGIGLAATQVNRHQRIITIDVEGDKTNQLVLINPEIIESCGETGIEEGCLSVPGFRGLVPRKEKVTVTALNRQGESFTLEADGLLAICIQHEIDHLNGKMFVDYLSPLKRNRIKEKLEKYKKQVERANKNN
ncbi:peptide deformylase [Gallibacterium trehalosifermentans]|uniref:Peptide deformylase n=1 Tax=Gallibacterium trehalosifermentans TaxID=516935 RepID=A0ABV6GZ51_9PAST